MNEKIMGALIMFALVFVIVYFVYYFIFDDMLKKEKYTKISELGLLVRKFNLDKKKMDYKKCLNGVAVINAFIISFTFTLIDFIEIDIIFTLLFAFVVLTVLILVCYFSYGKYLNKKWGKK
ncbi:MAG: hypothetical protein IJ475_00390 [Bacilli bacterium]|nr:hypothetical protein [Bacilli bacterium]